ncbi:MAG: PAS domain S-box protein [Candidatus Marinimicrobia bacterium]|nr:PAS domain S-box protein [Candidatus Neomarinimicrobiota bacterium]
MQMDARSFLGQQLLKITESEEIDMETWGFFQILLDHLPQAVFWKDSESTYLGCNMTFANHLNLEAPADIVGKTDFELFDQADARLFRGYDREIIESGEALLDYEEIVQKPPGGVIWTKTSKIPVKNKNGNVQIILGMYEDVTERKLAEIALRKSETKYRAVIEQSSDGIIISDQDGIIIEINAATESLLGAERDKAIGSYLWDFQKQFSLNASEAEDTLKEFKLWQDKISQDKAAEWAGEPRITKVRAGDRTIKTIQTVIFTVRANGKWLLGSFVRDISKRKKLEQQIEDELIFYKSLLDNVPMPVFHKDNQGRYQGANKAFEDFFGVEPEEYLGKKTLSVHPTYNDIHAVDIDERLLNNPDKISYRWVMTRYDNEDREVIISKSTFKDGFGEVSGIVGSIHDITDRIKREVELESREQNFKSIFHNASDPIFIHTMDGVVIEVNESAAEHLGYDRDELRHMTLKDFDTPKFAEKIPEKIRELKQSGRAYFLSQHRTKDNRIVDVELHSQIIDFHGEPAIMSIARDITSRKKLIQQEVVYNVMDSLETGILMADNSSRITHINEIFARMLGYSRSELEDLSINNILVHDTFKELRDRHIQTLRQKGSTLLKLNLQGKDGSVHNLPILVRAVFDSKQKPQSFYGVVQQHLNRQHKAFDGDLSRGDLSTLCASCKRVQTDMDHWIKVEQFLLQNYDILFSHGLCPECLNSLYMESGE